MAAASLASIMRDQVALSVTCLDRLYLNGYVPTLQTPGQLVRFCREHLGKPIASPALFRPLHDRFVQAVEVFAQQQQVISASPPRHCASPAPRRRTRPTPERCLKLDSPFNAPRLTAR